MNESRETKERIGNGSGFGNRQRVSDERRDLTPSRSSVERLHAIHLNPTVGARRPGRTWVGWWSLGPLALVFVWLGLNPRVFPPIQQPVKWASKGIYGEKIWANDRSAVPWHHRNAFRLIAIPGVAGIALLGWGLMALAVWPTLVGVTLVVLAQLWRIDRLVWMYEELHRGMCS